MRRRRPCQADADPDEDVGEPDLPVGDALLPEEQHPEEGEQQEDVADEEREPGPSHLHELRRARSDEDHEDDCGQDGGAGLDGRVAEHVLEVLLAHKRRSHERAEHDDPCARRHPEDPPGGDVEVVERVPRAALPEDEPDPGRDRDGEQPDRQGSLVRDRREVDPEDQRPDHDDRENAPEVVDRVRRLVDVARHEDDRHQQGDPHERKRDEEDRSPPELLQEAPRDERPERGDAAADRGPERDRPRAARARPKRRDQRKRGGVSHAGGEPADQARDEENLVRRRIRGQEAGRDGQDHAQHEQQLAPVAVADRTQPED
jgi:hypothetical protein